jgi:hypothetical protein
MIYSATLGSKKPRHDGGVKLTKDGLSPNVVPSSSNVRDDSVFYLVSAAVVGVVAGVCTAPDLGMTVSFMLVDGMSGLYSPTV